jgi:hypothetical protein
MERRFDDFRGEMHREFDNFRVAIHQQLANFKVDLIKWMFAFWVLQTGSIFAMLKYLH